MRPPAEYLAEVAERHPGALQSQWIPEDPDLWLPDNYRDFLAARQTLLSDAANAFLDRLRGGMAPDPGALPVAAPPVDAEVDPRAQEVARAVAELIELGCVAPALDAEICDPDTGRVLAVAEALWAEGLQPGIGSPVLLELDPDDADLARLQELGFEVFNSTSALVGNVRRQSIDAAEVPLPTGVG
jgi:hypothetical protein